jgi:1,4-dihydroxy-2-naphthoate octaprenyltransferase
VGKRTLALLLGSRWGMLFGLFVILFVPYMLVGTGVFWGLSPWYLCVFITFPWAVCLFSLMVDYTANPDKKALRRPWMGPMARWEKIEAAGIDWFMLRWYLARNLLTLFCLIIAVVSLAIAV